MAQGTPRRRSSSASTQSLSMRRFCASGFRICRLLVGCLNLNRRRNSMSFVDQVNVDFYERLFADDGWVHKYPNVNTVRCELWYFRQRQWPGRLLDYGYQVYGVEISPTAIDR